MVGRHRRPRTSEPATSAGDPAAHRGVATVRGRHGRLGGIDGRHPAAARLRGQGGRLRRPPPGRGRRFGGRARHGGRRLGADGRLRRSLGVGDARPRFWGAKSCRNARLLVEIGRPGGGYVGPIAVLAAVSVVLGVVPSLADGIIGAAAESLDGDSHGVHLAVWHGVNLALVLSAVALAAGAALFLGRRRVERLLALGTPIPSGTAVYAAVLRGTNTVSDRVTAVVQNGSLPIYAAIVLLTAAVVPETVLVAGTTWPGWPDFVDGSGQLVVVVALLGAARRRRPRPPPLRGRAVPRHDRLRDGRAVRGAGRTRPRPHPGGHRDALDRAVRARPAPPAGPLRANLQRQPADRAHRDRARRRGDGLHVRHRQPGAPHGTAGVDRDGGAGAARGPRPQHRQRDPRRHPRARHPRRDHRARRRGDRRGGPGPRRPAAGRRRRRTSPRPTSAATEQRDDPACRSSNARCACCSRRWSSARSTCCSPGTTSPAAASSAGWSPARRSPCATSPAA